MQKNNSKSREWSSPEIISFEDIDKTIGRLRRANVVRPNIIDEIDSALSELYDYINPSEKDNRNEQKYSEYISQKSKYGKWVYYSWNNTIVRVPDKKDFCRLITSRNRNLINEDEQHKLINSKILILGLSVGSNIAQTLCLQSIGSTYGLADMDTIEPTNLNRIRAPYAHVGLHKADSLARQLSEANPYLSMELFREGINIKNTDEIINKFKPDIIIDEMDQVNVKILVRECAKKLQVPVISAADNGDGVLVDVERYDFDCKDIYNNLIPQHIIHLIKSAEQINRKELGLIIGKYFVGSDNIPLRMYESLTEVGRTLPSWPQLGTAATIAGGYVGYAAKNILLGGNLKSGRYSIVPSSVFNTENLSVEDSSRLNEYISGIDSTTL